MYFYVLLCIQVGGNISKAKNWQRFPKEETDEIVLTRPGILMRSIIEIMFLDQD